MNSEKSIVITGASGKTGKAIISQLSNNGYTVTAFAHKESYRSELLACGASKIVIGDLRSRTDLENAFSENRAIYHICPNMTQDEYEIGRNIIQICQKTGTSRFIYHSVLHPHIQSMPHHWQKLLVEEELFKSSLEYTILQPAAYMQNILGYHKSIQSGIFPVPYSPEALISLVDLRDVAAVALLVLKNEKYINGIYELAGTTPLSQYEVADELTKVLERKISVEVINRNQWENNAINSGMADYPRKTLLSMFEYYEQYGLKGSPTTLSYLLGRNPITIGQFIKDHIQQFINQELQ